MCDDDTTNGDEKVSSGDLQLFMQYFNRSSLVICGCWCDDVMVPGMLLGGWVGLCQGWLALQVVEALAHFNSFNARVTPGRAVAALPQR